MAEMESHLLTIDSKMSSIASMQREIGKPPEVPPSAEAQAKIASQAEPQLDYAALMGDPPIPAGPSTVIKQGSRLCRQGDFATDGFRYWITEMHHPLQMNRKLWEWFFTADALYQRDMLQPGRRGLGFGVGREPLSALFAARGCDILATDMSVDSATVAGWAGAGQHAGALGELNTLGICQAADFAERVSFRPMNMNDIPLDLTDSFDFCWSSCALEHLGSLEHGMRFVEAAMRILKPGGVAVHTTEYNMSSVDGTFEAPELSLYRKTDLESLVGRLGAAGHMVEPFDWTHGSGFADGYVDLPPYFSTPLHIRLRIAQFDCTSIGFIVHKGRVPAG